MSRVKRVKRRELLKLPKSAGGLVRCAQLKVRQQHYVGSSQGDLNTYLNLKLAMAKNVNDVESEKDG